MNAITHLYAELRAFERLGQLDFVNVTVRFFPEVMAFIQEGEKRHPSREICEGLKTQDGQPTYIDYKVKLPPRSLNEFSRMNSVVGFIAL